MAGAANDIHRVLFEHAPDGLILADPQGTIVMANDEAATIFGYAPGALRGRNVDDLVPQRDRATHAGHRMAFGLQPRRRPMGAGLQLHGLRADGREFPLEISLNPVRVDGQHLVLAAVRDITDLMRAKRALRSERYSAAIARFGVEALGEMNLDHLLEAVPPLISRAMAVDAVIILRLSPDGRTFTSVASSGIPDRLHLALRIPNDPRYLAGYVAAERGPVISTDLRREQRFTVPDEIAQLGFLSVACVPLFDRERVVGLITARALQPRSYGEDDLNFLQAIANIVATASQRTTAEERLLHAQRLESLGQLTGGVAHDFNNLLMVISGNLQVLEELLPTGGEQQELARAAAAAVERGAMLTRKLLAFARKQSLHPRPFELGQLIRDFRELVRRTLGENVVVRLKLDPDVPTIVADPNQLETALLNLAVNARDAMTGGGTLSLETRRVVVERQMAGDLAELEPGHYVMIGVSDSGAGMAPETVARAFEPFFTTKETGKGSGLGLSMVYGFARQSGGTVKIYSEPGRGTIVRLFLPCPANPISRVEDAGRATTPGGKEVVLVVEDEVAVRDVAVLFLRTLGYTVLQAPDAERALDLLRQRDDVELLFTDVVLPGMNGVELARAAREMRPDIAVAYTSGYASASMLGDLPQHELRDLLSKPYRREDLAVAVRRALEESKRGLD